MNICETFVPGWLNWGDMMSRPLGGLPSRPFFALGRNSILDRNNQIHQPKCFNILTIHDRLLALLRCVYYIGITSCRLPFNDAQTRSDKLYSVYTPEPQICVLRGFFRHNPRSLPTPAQCLCCGERRRWR